MEKVLTENGKKVLDYVAAHDGDCTAKDIAEGTGLTVKQVVAIVTFTFAKNKFLKGEEKITTPLMERVKAEIEDENGKHESITLIRLTDAGKDTLYLTLN